MGGQGDFVLDTEMLGALPIVTRSCMALSSQLVRRENGAAVPAAKVESRWAWRSDVRPWRRNLVGRQPGMWAIAATSTRNCSRAMGATTTVDVGGTAPVKTVFRTAPTAAACSAAAR